MPGKLLGANLSITNKTYSEQIIELSIDVSNYTFSKKGLIENFPALAQKPNDLANYPIPFSLQPTSTDRKDKILNTEMRYECWFIENPVTKELTKRITLKLGPKATQEFVIVIKSPNLKLE